MNTKEIQEIAKENRRWLTKSEAITLRQWLVAKYGEDGLNRETVEHVLPVVRILPWGMKIGW